MDAISWLTALVAGVTAWMAYETRRMSQVASRTLAFEQRPYLAFIDVDVYPGDPAKPVLRPIIVWENKGRVLIHFKVELLEVDAENSIPSNPALVGAEGVAFPGVRVEFEGPTIERVDINKYWKGKLHFKVSYGMDANNRMYVAEEWLDFYGGKTAAGEKYVEWKRARPPHYT